MTAQIYESDTIAAISTAVSESGIGIIRVSGPGAIPAADQIFRTKSGRAVLKEAPTHTIHYGFIEQDGHRIDEVLLSVLRAPRSFTREDTVEINCHGGIYAMHRVLEAVLAQGVRAAEPGEFTRRAFLNGRIDLSEAEAVMDVIRASSEKALSCSMDLLTGRLRRLIEGMRGEILHQAAYIEAALDDPEHYDLDGFEDQLRPMLADWESRMDRLIRTADHGRQIREGIQTVILGRPNAGKSSLMNQLLGEERAIVTEVEGTTRDTISETIHLGEVSLKIIDTAGIRTATDPVEQIGVERALQAAGSADLILYVVDSSAPLDENDSQILSSILEIGCPYLILLNKSDLEAVTGEGQIEELVRKAGRQADGDAGGCVSEIDGLSVMSAPEDVTKDNAATTLDTNIQRMNGSVCRGKPCVVAVSALDGNGMDELTRRLEEMFAQGQISYNDEVMITHERQKLCLVRAREALGRVQESLDNGMPEDFLTIDMSDCCRELGLITGETADEDLIREIFESFCMGK